MGGNWRANKIGKRKIQLLQEKLRQSLNVMWAEIHRLLQVFLVLSFACKGCQQFQGDSKKLNIDGKNTSARGADKDIWEVFSRGGQKLKKKGYYGRKH